MTNSDRQPSLGSHPDSKPSHLILGRRIILNSTWNVAAYSISTLIGVVSLPLYVQFLGLSHYGLLALFNSVLAPLGLLNAGFGQATVKYIAEAVGRDDKFAAGVYLRTTLLFNLCFSIFGMLVVVLLGAPLAARFFRISPSDLDLAITGFRWVSIIWALTQISTTFMAIPVAFQNYALVSTVSTVVSGISIFLGLVVLFEGGTLIALLEMRAAWSFVVVCLWMWIGKQLLPGLSFSPMWNKSAFRKTFGFASWQAIGSIGGTLSQQSDRYILGAYLSPAAVGVYYLAWNLMGVLNTAVHKMGEVLFPAISALGSTARGDQTGVLVMRSSWFLSVLMIAILGPVGVFAHDILRLYVGNEIADAGSTLLQVLVLSVIASSASIAPAQYLLGVGRTDWNATATFASGLIVFLCSIALVPRLGLLGAGWGQMIMVLATRPLLHYLLWKRYLRESIPIKIYATYLYGPVSAGLGLVSAFSLMRRSIPWEPNLWTTITAILVVSLFLIGLILLLDRWMPGGAARHNEILQILRAAQSKIHGRISENRTKCP